jgi:hypothetical protein
MAPVCNTNAATQWLLRHNENCLITEPFPSCVAAAVGRLVDDPELRLKVATAGHEDVVNTSWDRELERTWRFITNQPLDSAP